MNSAKSIAFLTSSELPRLTEDDRIAVVTLEQYGITVEPVIWDSPSVKWKKYDLIVVRSPWDYFRKPKEFSAWLDRIELLHLPLYNSLNTIRWNMDKTYLRDLSAKGFSVPPTIWVERQSGTTLREILERCPWKNSVIKPTISGSAFETWVIASTLSGEDEARFQQLNAGYGVMVQQFMEEVPANGELSMIFFDKKYSHSVLKRAKKNDFRVQSDFGGTVHPISPPAYLIDQAFAIIDSVADPLLYARVDGVEHDGKLILMELEILEPALFFHADAKAPERFAESIQRKL